MNYLSRMLKIAALVVLVIGGIAGCSSLDDTPFSHKKSYGNVVYVSTNRADGNTVAVFKKKDGGDYTLISEYHTGGKGTGDLEVPALKKDPTHPLANGDDPLISAYGIIETADKKHLLVVNPGDSSISLMRIQKDYSLTLINKVMASDRFPVSIATHSNNRVVVASVGETNNEGSIKSYIIQGTLKAVEGSRRDLHARPSTVAFNGKGDFVVVNELITGKIRSFGFHGDSLTKNPVSTIDSPRHLEIRFQAIPVGFDIRSEENGDTIYMTEARFLTPDFKLRLADKEEVPQSPKYSWQTSSLSTYHLSSKGELSLVSEDVLTGDTIEDGEIASCWVVISDDGETAYVTNASVSSLSRFSLATDGSATLEDATAYKDSSELLFFSDVTIGEGGKQVFLLVGNKGAIMVLDIIHDGSLELNHVASGMPELGTYGIVTM